MRTRGVKMDFEKIISRGENPNGFTSQTANGTAKWKGSGWNQTGPSTPSGWPELPYDATRPDGRNNRTGE